MKRFLQVLVLFLFLGCSPQMFAQCSEFETEVILILNSDTYGVEMYWEVELQGFLIASGGCEDIKPGGLRIQNGLAGCDGLYDSGTFVESICIPSGQEVTFTIYDDYGDGICCQFGEGSYEILGADPPVSGGAFGNSMSHTFMPVGVDSRTDVAMRSITTGNFDYLVEGPTAITGSFENVGTTTVNSVVVNWQIDGGNTYKATIDGLDIAPFSFEEIDFTHLTEWSAISGMHDLKIWVSKVNGFADDDPSNNSLNKNINVLEQVIENDVVVEHFTQASCGPCAIYNPAFDAVIDQQRFRVAPIKYHTSWPGFDPMYNENPTEPSDRVAYYGVGGVPDAYLNGTTRVDLPNAATTSEQPIIDMSNIPTQFVIELNESMNEMGTGANINVKITAKNDIDNSNLVAHVVVTEEMVEYDTAPGSNGEAEFPQVMRKMLPNSLGTSLAVQTMDMSTDLSFSYDYPSFVHPEQLRTVVFIQDRVTQEVLQGYNSSGQTGTNVESNEKGGSVAGLGVVVDVQDEFCPGANDGTITVNATQANGIFAVLWEGIGSTNNTVSDLEPGVYTFTVVDGAGTQESYSVEVLAGEGPDARFDSPEQFCIEDGKVAFEVLGNEGGTFAINGENIDSNEWNPEKAGIYTVSYTVALDCPTPNVWERQIEVLDPIDAEWSTENDIFEFCQNEFPLQLMANNENGTWSSSDGTINTTENGAEFTANIGSLPNGVFAITYSGCGSTVTKNVTVHKEPSVTISTNPNITVCASDVETGISLQGIPAICGCDLTFNVYNEDGDLVYEGTEVNQDMFYPAMYLSNDSEGTYKFYATSVNGLCEGPQKELIVTATPAPTVDWDGVFILEEGGTVTLDATNEGATYLWSTNETTPTIEVTEIGYYSVDITGANGCVTRVEATVDFNTNIEDLNKPSLVRSYPNPANQVSTIELVNITEDLTLQVRDLAGRLIMTRDIDSGTTQVQVKTNDLAEGTYLYQLSKDDTILSTQKIVVLH